MYYCPSIFDLRGWAKFKTFFAEMAIAAYRGPEMGLVATAARSANQKSQKALLVIILLPSPIHRHPTSHRQLQRPALSTTRNGQMEGTSIYSKPK